MDRIIVYPGEIPTDEMFLDTNKNVMVALGYMMQAILGTSTLVDGLACTPTGPAGMTVNVAGGSIYSLAQIDATAYGSINADTADQIVKQGIVIGTQNFSCPAPGTVGQSVVYLVEAAYQDVDTGSTVLPYYNASNPSQAYSGPANSGAAQNTIRQGLCKVQVKTGVAATTGTQVTPSPDAGFTGLFAITVAHTDTTITSGSIAQLATAPFITPKLPGMIAAVQSGAAVYADDTSVTANTITVALSPALTGAIGKGQPLRIKIANTTTGNPVISTNGGGNVAIKLPDGSNPPPLLFKALGLYSFINDGTNWQYQGQVVREFLTANRTYYVSTTGSDSNNGLTSGTAFLTLQKAADVIHNMLDLAGFTVTVSVADGTYTAGVAINYPFSGAGNVQFTGNVTTPANCIISTTGTDCFLSFDGPSFSIQGFKLQTTTGGSCVRSYGDGIVTINGNMNFGTCAQNQIFSHRCGNIVITSNYTISGGAQAHWYTDTATAIAVTSGLTVTLTGTPAFSTAFAVATQCGVITCASETFSGSATGPRYLASNNGVINTGGGGSTYLPGSTSGTATTGIYA